MINFDCDRTFGDGKQMITPIQPDSAKNTLNAKKQTKDLAACGKPRSGISNLIVMWRCGIGADVTDSPARNMHELLPFLERIEDGIVEVPECFRSLQNKDASVDLMVSHAC